MKKIFTLVAATMMAAGAFAQTEAAFVDVDALNILPSVDKVYQSSYTAGTILCESASVKMSALNDDAVQSVAMAGEADPFNTITIDGVDYLMTTGVQGNSNGKDALTGGNANGWQEKFEVTEDGYLYVFGKLSYNKGYYVWEGDIVNGAASLVGYHYEGALQDATLADPKVSYDLPANDPDGYGWYIAAEEDGYNNGMTKLNWPSQMPNSNYGASTKGALGFVSFPVYKEAGEYYVYAAGSKWTGNGFVFVPGATAKGEVSFKKGDAAGINNIAATTINSNVAYNLAGQRVAANAKGIKIINGKKVIK